jgi:hypothetical protein
VSVEPVEIALDAPPRRQPPAGTGFAFLTCVADQWRFERLLRSIEELAVPGGVELRVFFARGATSLSVAYNRLQAAAAGWRYKAYVHDDIVVLNHALLGDLLRLFRNRRIGLVGAAGCRYLPESCLWWDGSGVFGRVLELSDDRVLELEQPARAYERVEAVDGIFQVTQHDLPWDEAIPGFHFYDIAQSTQYMLAGYDVVVPHQDEPWVGHDWAARRRISESAEYLAAREVFRARYGDRRARLARSPIRRRLRRLTAGLR